ncbi:MAG: TonB-dependent receptor, partial [Hyphomonadaceae bacterium]
MTDAGYNAYAYGLATSGVYPTAAPTTVAPTSANLTLYQDPGCGTFNGGDNGEYGPILNPAGQCRFNSVAFSNLAEDEHRYQIFSEFNHDFADGSKLHLEALFARTAAGYTTTPSFPPPNVSLQYQPAANPGVQDYITWLNLNGRAADAALISANGIRYNGRLFGPGITGRSTIHGTRVYETNRLAGAYTGTFESGWLKDVDYDFHITWSRSEASGVGADDIYIDRARLALLGLGGPNCDPATGTPGVGNCQWLSTFSTAQPGSVLDPNINNPAYNPATGLGYHAQPNTNTPELVNWLFGPGLESTFTNELTVAEAVFSGQLGWALGGGNASYAVGAQLRAERYQSDPSNINNVLLNPCTIEGDVTCGTSAGVFQFNPPFLPVTDSRLVEAVFGELQLPITDKLSMQVALRYESFPGATGDTLDPKIQVRYEPTEWLVLRGSAQTAFRAPTLNQLSDVSTTQTPFVGSVYIPFDTLGNPALTPETSFSYNLGAIVDFR